MCHTAERSACCTHTGSFDIATSTSASTKLGLGLHMDLLLRQVLSATGFDWQDRRHTTDTPSVGCSRGRLSRPILGFQLLDAAEHAVVRDQNGAGSDRLGGDHHVEVGHGSTRVLQRAAQVRITKPLLGDPSARW